MSGPAPQRDVLSAGPDGPAVTAPMTRVLIALGLLAALVVGASHLDLSTRGAPAGNEPLEVALRSGAFAVPPTGPFPEEPEVTLLVEVVNTGRRTVVLTSAALTPGLWQVEVLEDAPLHPHWSTALALRRLVGCDSGGQGLEVPDDLALVATVDGRQVMRHVSLDEVRPGYGGPLEEVLRSASVSCGVRRGYDTG